MRTGRRWARRSFAALSGAGVLVLALGAVWAPPAAADPVVAVKVGVDGHVRPDRPTPVVVTVTADRALRGKVVVEPELGGGGGPFGPISVAATEIPVELSAGTTKDFLVVVPGPFMRSGNSSHRELRVNARLLDGAAEVTKGTAEGEWDEGYELVGVLPSLVTGTRLPDDLPLRLGGTGRATLAAVDVPQLDTGIGGGALGPFASIVAAPEDLTALSPATRHALFEWLDQGGQLYVDATTAPVPVLPDAWQPRDGWASAGDGVVRLSHGHASAGQWSAFLEPTRGAWAYLDNGSSFAYGPSSSVAGVLGADAGVVIPQLSMLLALTVVYVIVIGPVSFIVLARLGRRTLAWLTVPALSVLFTGAFALTGISARSDTHPAHATIIELGEGGAHARSAALLGSASGGRFDLRLPAGWRSAMNISQSWNPRAVVESAPLSVDGNGARVVVDLTSGEFRQVTATGPLPGYGTPLRIEATSDGQQITGSVRNDLDVDLHQVTVMAHNDTLVLGTVPARSERPFTLTGALHRAPFPGMQAPLTPEVGYWPRYRNVGTVTYGGMPGGACTGYCPPAMPAPPSSPPFSDHGDTLNEPLWQDHAASRMLPLRRAGAVSVVGWTRELPSPLTLDGQGPLTAGRTGIVARSAIQPDPAKPFESVGARLEQVRATKMNDLDPEVDPVEDYVIGPIYRLIVPRGVAPDSIVIEPPEAYKRLAISSAPGWKVTPEVTAPIRYRLQPEDVVDGVVYLQVRLPDSLNVGEHTDPYQGWRLRAAVPGEELTPAVLAADAGGVG